MQHKKNTSKKCLGDWGEKQVDIWMLGKNWKISCANQRIYRGEIDRIYTDSTPPTQYLIAEIKTVSIKSIANLTWVLKEDYFLHLSKANQIQNLFKIADKYQRTAPSTTKIWVRLFIVICIESGDGERTLSIEQTRALPKILQIRPHFWIMATEPSPH